jgi:hypothetical protein
MANYSDISRLWEITIVEADEIFAEISTWKPVLAEEIKKPT